MRTQRRNQQKMYYALYDKEIPIYATDEEGNIIYDSYTTEEGETITYPIEVERVSGYSDAVPFKGNIAMSGGEAEAVEFGLSTADYEAVLVMDKDEIPIVEGSKIWHTTEPKKNADGTTDEFSADYFVVKYSPSINVDKYVLQKVVK